MRRLLLVTIISAVLGAAPRAEATDVPVQRVPEPGTLIMLGTGLLSLAYVVRRHGKSTTKAVRNGRL